MHVHTSGLLDTSGSPLHPDFLGFMIVGLFILIVLQAPWMALMFGVLAGLFAVWFVRGLEHDVDEVGYRRCGSEGVRQPTERRYTPSRDSLADTNPHDRLRRLSDLRQEGYLSAEEYEAKRQEILREL
jgi:Short C-terminal domain